MDWHGISLRFYPAGDESELIREKVEQCVLMMVVGMVSLGSSLGVVLMYIAYASLNDSGNYIASVPRSNASLSVRSMVWPWQKCAAPKFYKCSSKLDSGPEPGSESWFFLQTRFGPGCFEWDSGAQCPWRSPAHFADLALCRRNCHRVPPARRCLEPLVQLPPDNECAMPAPKERRAAARLWWFYDPLRHRCQRWTDVCVFRAFPSFEDCFKRCLAH